MPKRKLKDSLSVDKVLKEFREYEESSGHRKGTFKIDAPFDEALKKILKAKPTKQAGKSKSKK